MAARSGKPAKNFPVKVQPAVLQWTRKTVNLRVDEIARKLKTEQTEIEAWEAGTSSPTYAQLESLAKHYKRPIAIFYLPEPPRDFKVPKGDFRRRPAGHKAGISLALSLEFRRVHMQREVALSLAELTGEPVPRVDLEVAVSDQPAVAARRVRAWLGVTLADQLTWEDEYEILSGWTRPVEARGILVAQATGVSTAEMRGFAISDRPFPVVVLNAADAPRARLFTLLHEVAHVLMRTEGLCDLHDEPVPNKSPLDRIETFCNRVASFVVLPPEVVRLDLGDGGWNDADLTRMSKRYGLSAEAVLRHLVTLGRASWDEYLAWREDNERRYADAKARAGGGSYYRNQLARLGRRYASDVIDAYDRDLITAMDASDFLDMRIVNFPKLAELIETGG